LLKWLREQLFRDLEGPDVYAKIFAELATLGDAPVPSVMPYFAAGGPLDSAAGGQGAICGLSLGSSRAGILKGALEGIVFYFKDAFSKLPELKRLHVNGGGAESALWLQMIADILRIPVVKPEGRECGALGAAILAGVGAGRFKSISEGVATMVRSGREYTPGRDYEKEFRRHMALKKALSIVK
jgi:sugar (pentulose or hexulose) kinase